MSESPTVLSPDVQRLVDEGYTVTIVQDRYIIVDDVPYVSEAGTVSRAAIISYYREKDGIAVVGGDHTVWFTGTVPCTPSGESLAKAMIVDTDKIEVAGRTVQCRFSYKSERADTLDDFYNKLTHYIRKLQGYANVIDPSASAARQGTISVRQERSVFFYPNTATAREGLDAYEKKLRLRKIAIVGLGGTGSYILDAVAKTPVEEIDLYDSDVIEPANGYRMPGALSIEEAHEGLRKTEYLAQVYGRMRTGIQSHPVRIEETNVDHLNDCEFVFIAVDHGPSRGLIARHLAQRNIPFIDVGIGVEKVPEDVQLRARVRATAVTNASKALVEGLPVGDDEEDVVYNNIQVAELNAVNAMLAVVLYKQKIGFFAEEIPVSKLRYVSSWQRLSNDAAEKI